MTLAVSGLVCALKKSELVLVVECDSTDYKMSEFSNGGNLASLVLNIVVFLFLKKCIFVQSHVALMSRISCRGSK